MKKTITILLSLIILFAAGCDYTAILSEKQGLPLDNNLFGTWGFGTDGGFINISKSSESEYSVQFFEKGEEVRDKAVGFLGYPIKIGNFYCVQLRTQTEDNSEKKRYVVITYEISDNTLTVKKLNPNVISNNAETSSDLKKLFFKYKDNPDLFTDAGIYKRVEFSNKPATTTKPATLTKPSVNKPN